MQVIHLSKYYRCVEIMLQILYFSNHAGTRWEVWLWTSVITLLAYEIHRSYRIRTWDRTLQITPVSSPCAHIWQLKINLSRILLQGTSTVNTWDRKHTHTSFRLTLRDLVLVYWLPWKQQCTYLTPNSLLGDVCLQNAWVRFLRVAIVQYF